MVGVIGRGNELPLEVMRPPSVEVSKHRPNWREFKHWVMG